MRLRRLGVSAIVLAVLCACGQAAASQPGAPAAWGAAKAKKHGAVRCRRGQARLHAGRRAMCVPNRLPAVLAPPQAVLVSTALGLSLGDTRDRHGRRAPSFARLLRRIGPHAAPRLKTAIARGLARGEVLLRHGLPAPDSPAGSPIAFAARNCVGLDPARVKDEFDKAPPDAKQSFQEEYDKAVKGSTFKSGDLSASLDIGSGAIKLGLDDKTKGTTVELTIRSCGEDGLQLDACPTAEGKVKGEDHVEFELGAKVREGPKLVFSRTFKFTGRTTIEAQTGDDGKLDHYDIKHIYELDANFGGGTKEPFGPVSIAISYIGEARIDMRSPGAKPPPAIVDVRAVAAGTDPAAVIASEIKLAKESQQTADQEFSAEVTKTTKRLRAAETNWRTPNNCASLHFEPPARSIRLKKGQAGSFQTRLDAKPGGSPAAASWVISKQQNATFTPAGGEPNPLSSSYTVTKAGGVYVEVTVKGTSKAGVAEAVWEQPTEGLETISGSFTGFIHNHGETFEWSGTATFKRLALPGEPEGPETFLLAAGEATVTASGTPLGFQCTQTGTQTLPLSHFGVWGIVPKGENFEYRFVAEFEQPATMDVDYVACKNEGEGGPREVSLLPAALQSGHVTVESGLLGIPKISFTENTKISADGHTFIESASEEPTPGETVAWAWQMTGS